MHFLTLISLFPIIIPITFLIILVIINFINYKKNIINKKAKLNPKPIIERILDKIENQNNDFIICIYFYHNYLKKSVNIPIYYLDIEDFTNIGTILVNKNYIITPITKKICCECVNDGVPIVIGYKVTKNI